MLAFTVHLSQIVIRTWAYSSDVAVTQVLNSEGAPFEAFRAIYQDNPVPGLSAAYGAPLGRQSKALDPEGQWRSDIVPLDEGGYDAGGAYWGLRRLGENLYSVQDGVGNIAFVDAPSDKVALEVAAAA